MLDTVYVCTHALDRWRERASEHAFAPEEEVIETLRASRKVQHDEFLPIPRQQGTHYYHHAEHDAYFVVEPIDRTSCRIVTVIVPGVPRNYVLPKKKIKKDKTPPTPPTVEETRIHVTPALADSETLSTLEKVMQRIMPEETPPDDDVDAHEYRRYVNMMHEIERRLGGLTRNQPLRKQLVAQLNEIKKKLLVLKPSYRKYINDLEQRMNDMPIRPDGSVNYVAAILHLMKKTDEQQKEIEELKSTVTQLVNALSVK